MGSNGIAGHRAYLPDEGQDKRMGWAMHHHDRQYKIKMRGAREYRKADNANV